MSLLSSLLKPASALPLLEISGLTFTKPVFILSAPRSGSSYFYEVVRKMQHVLSFEYENDPLWRYFFPYERFELPSDYISARELDSRTIRGIQQAFYLKYLNKPAHLNRSVLWQAVVQQGVWCRQPIRYLEKTIANCFHLEALTKIFPDALYIHLVRDGRECVSSMMDGWASGHFARRPFPPMNDATVTHWCYPFPPGWEKVIDRPLQDICAWSWIQHNQYVLDKCGQATDFSHRCLRVRFEDFLADPLAVTTQVADFLELEMSDEVRDRIRAKQPSWTTVTPPKKDKWKQHNQAKIESIFPTLLPTMGAFGYSL